MKKITLIALSLLAACTSNQNKMLPKQLPQEPIAQKIDTAITWHDHTRIDPYFWMRLTDEQKNAATPDAQTQQVLDYLNAENAYTESAMVNTVDLQKNLYDEMVGRIKKDDESVPYFKNEYWYYTRYEENGQYPLYCRKKGTLDAPEEIYLDVNKLAEGKSYYAVGGASISPDNTILAYSEDVVSRRIYTIRFKNLVTGEMYSDEIENTTGSITWANDNKTVFYVSKNKVTLLGEKIWRHVLSKKNDALVYEEKDPTNYIGIWKTKSGKYLVINSESPTSNEILILNANNPQSEFSIFTPRTENHLYSISHFEDKFYVLSNSDALNFKLMQTSETATEQSNWKEIIPHRADVLLEGIDVFKNYLVVSEKKNALNHIRIINQQTQTEHYLEFPEEVYLAGTSVNPEFNTEILRYSYTSLTTPSSVIDYDMNTRVSEVKKTTEVIGGHNPDNYEARRLWVTSRDGVQIPVSMVYKKGVEMNGNAPLLLYAYGSYGSSTDAYFSTIRLSLLDRGFIYAIAHIRGGQEMGRHWYEDGKMLHKINTFNDYIDCARFMIENKYTSEEHLYAEGGSAGGLLMGAVINDAPELFNGVIAAVPFVDVINTMLDETIPLTTNEFDEWGNPKIKEYYDYMLKYSPYDNVKAMAYPNLLITTGLFDSQVQYWEPAKWIAKLRDQRSNNNLLIMKTNMEAGHGGASGRFEYLKEVALEYSFFLMLEGIEK